MHTALSAALWVLRVQITAAVILLAAAKARRRERGMEERSEETGVAVIESSSLQVTGKEQTVNGERMRKRVGEE